ncbi:MAG: PHB depolymerase family esterase [Polyangia bacterium]
MKTIGSLLGSFTLRLSLAGLLGLGLLGAGCAPPEPEPVDDPMKMSMNEKPRDPNQIVPTTAEAMAAAVKVKAREYDSTIPRGYSDDKLWPLIVLLHGYGANGAAQDLLFGLSSEATRLGYLLAKPDGTVDSKGSHFWNATDACCDFDKTGVDDVGYIDALITDMAARYRIDRRRVFLVGHSNGGFMSYRMACDRSPRIAALVSLAGANFADPARCKPSEPVAVLQVHGDKDSAVPYQGGTDGNRTIPSARQSVESFAKLGGCTDRPVVGDAIDIEDDLAGSETAVLRWTGCQRGGAELWTIQGGSHVPVLKRPAWPEQIFAWLSAHAKQ